jgi:adenine/guanine phosphoribosyltransferase-like PRPP-binding protein
VHASAVALKIENPLAFIREAGKLPPPTIYNTKPCSKTSALTSKATQNKRIEMERDILPRDGCAVVVDDVVATGATLCAGSSCSTKLALAQIG